MIMSRIQELARIIAFHTDVIDKFLFSNDLPRPSFDIDGLEMSSLPKDIQKSRDNVIDATTELKELLQGPKELLMSNSVSQTLEISSYWGFLIFAPFSQISYSACEPSTSTNLRKPFLLVLK
jgi:hypothetical protein